jgi:hypothetical protein
VGGIGDVVWGVVSEVRWHKVVTGGSFERLGDLWDFGDLGIRRSRGFKRDIEGGKLKSLAVTLGK